MDNPFAKEWRLCTEALYKEYIVEGINHDGIHIVMDDMGYTETDLSNLKIEAHIRDVNYEPSAKELNLDKVNAEDYHEDMVAHPMECQCPGCMDKIVIKPDVPVAHRVAEREDDSEEVWYEKL